MTIMAFVIPPLLLAELPPIQSFGVADGLAANQVNQIVPDSTGFIWFCTRQGLSRFDGHRMISFGPKDGLPHRQVTALLETRGGEYLIGTLAGLAAFHTGQGETLTTYLPGNSLAGDDLAGRKNANAITGLIQDSSGRIWCGTYAGLFEMISGHKFRRQALSAAAGQEQTLVSDLAEDRSHRLWVATPSGIDVLGEDGRARHIAIHDWTQNVRALALDGEGRVWAGTQGALVAMKSGPGEPGVARIYREVGGTKLDVTSLTRGPDGSLWAGTSAGVVRALGGGHFRMLTREQGLIDRQINAVASDRAGNMWAGTEAAGVMQIRTRGFITFREQDGLKTDRVWTVLPRRNGELVVVTNDPSPAAWVHFFDGQRFHRLSMETFTRHPSWGHHILLEARDGTWWGATSSGFCRYSAGDTSTLAGRQPEACYAPGMIILRIFEDSKGRIWAAGENNALFRWEPENRAVTRVEEGPGGTEGVASFAEDRHGNVWLGSFRGGSLFRYDGRHFTRFDQADGVPRGGVGEMFIDHAGQLWIASPNGLGVIENPGETRIRVRLFNTSSGLSGDAIGTVTEDRMGRIYASTANGVDRLNLQTGAVKHFTTADGLAHGNVNMAVRDASGNLWFATTQGLSRLSPAADASPSPPRVRITDLQIGRERYPVSRIGETLVSSRKLKPSENQLQVAFVGFSDEPESDLRYAYMLEGADTAWQGPGRTHEVNYAELAPGRYRFLVKAIDSEGGESASKAGIDFEIMPPVWQRWWFESIALAFVAAMAFLSYRRRLSSMTERVRLLYEERLDERTRIARELHDTLLQNLAGISLQLDGVAKQVGANSETATTIRAVRKQVDASFREARQKVQDLRSPMLQGRALPAVLRESAEQIASGHPVHLRLSVTGAPRPLREEVDEAVLRIGQEAVANAIRHANARKIDVSLAYEAESLRLYIADDGNGFDPDAGSRSGHWGLRNMQERAERIGAQWKITSGTGRGTAVEAIVPAPPNK